MDSNAQAKPQAHIVFNQQTLQGEMATCAYLDFHNPTECILEKDHNGLWLTLVIDATQMDELALAWCQQRQLGR